MANTDILREFLVKLGFQIDRTGERTFVDSVASMTVKAVKLGAAIKTSSVAVTAGVAKIASGLETLHFAAQRIGASAANIRALGFATAQMGGSAEGARASLEQLAHLMRANPGASGWLRSLGVATHDANGQLRDTSQILTDLGRRLARMPYYRAYAIAQVLGIDENTLLALQQGVGQFSATYRAMLRAAGLDAEQAAQSSHAFMNELRTLGSAGNILLQKAASLLTGKMGADIKRFRQFLVAHFDQIAKGIAVVVGWLLKVAEVISTLAIRAMQAVGSLADWFNSLSDSGQQVVKLFGLMLAAWWALNRGFLVTPLGAVLALATALLLLYDDYQVWKEGGQSLINWAVWEKQIERALFGLSKLGHALRGLAKMASDAWRGRWAAVADDWRAIQEAWHAPDVGGGFSQAELDASKTSGGRLTADAQRRLDAINSDPIRRALMFFQQKGWTPEQAAGIVANLKRESQLNPQAIGDSGQAVGLAQWHPSRQADFKRVFGKDIRASTLAEQLQFVHHELTQGLEKRAGALLRAARTADEAGQIVSKYYERPRETIREAARRGQEAIALAQLPFDFPCAVDAIAATHAASAPSLGGRAEAGAQANVSRSPDVALNQTNHITVTGVTDPHEVAEAIRQAQTDSQGRMIRHLRGAVVG